MCNSFPFCAFRRVSTVLTACFLCHSFADERSVPVAAESGLLTEIDASIAVIDCEFNMDNL